MQLTQKQLEEMWLSINTLDESLDMIFSEEIIRHDYPVSIKRVREEIKKIKNHLRLSLGT